VSGFLLARSYARAEAGSRPSPSGGCADLDPASALAFQGAKGKPHVQSAQSVNGTGRRGEPAQYVRRILDRAMRYAQAKPARVDRGSSRWIHCHAVPTRVYQIDHRRCRRPSAPCPVHRRGVSEWNHAIEPLGNDSIQIVN